MFVVQKLSEELNDKSMQSVVNGRAIFSFSVVFVVQKLSED